ncbi:MAG: hypothetical protein ABTQ29_08485 [Siculibacillus sp.]
MRTILIAAALSTAVAASAVRADHGPIESDYPGSWAIADGHGGVAVKVQYLPQSSCWRIRSAREGVPDAATAEPTGRMLYVTVAVEKTADACAVTNTPLETRLTVPDKPGRISLDVYFVDERGVLQRSQRHRIERECGASSSDAC